MTRRHGSAVIGKWRITETDLWDSSYLDMLEPAYIRFDKDGRGDMMFGAVRLGLDCSLSSNTAFFTFEGSDEMTPVSGAGSAELADNGLLEGELNFHLGDEAEFKARKW